MDETDKVYVAGTLFSKEMKAGEQIAFYRKGLRSPSRKRHIIQMVLWHFDAADA